MDDLNKTKNQLIAELKALRLQVLALEAKQADKKLQRYKHIVSTTQDLISLIEKNYVYQMVNDAYKKDINPI